MTKTLAKIAVFLFLLSASTFAGPAQAQWQSEWERVQAAARKEGKLVVAIPPSADLRKALEGTVKQKFGIELEIVLSNSATTTKRVGDEFKAGVRYFDVITSTWDALSYNLLPMGVVEPSGAVLDSSRCQGPGELVGRTYLDGFGEEVRLLSARLYAG